MLIDRTNDKLSPAQANVRTASFEVVVGSDERPRAEVTLSIGKDNEMRTDQATGDGPVDAIYRAIEHV
ncbi:MAG: alpha-isopropylmalate synthase regulatory domain-containing protein, partial [Candidatus Thermoplasmatota archaeon]|nr:alpha-isopropylmalate synthase regulatory domain-containing protein [Candidatus Thermoplasmatota archaeon]